MDKYNDLLNKISELKVAELAELVKAMETKFGISAAVAAAPAGAAGAAEVEEKTAWDVVLKDGGAQKIQVIKVLREATGLGLKEAKDMADGAPKTVKTGMKKEDAENLKKLLETAGAKVELK